MRRRGLYWMSVRAYDPVLGRFISHDPLGRLAALGLDTQPYVYVGNDPVNQSDPSGLYVPTRVLVDGGGDDEETLAGRGAAISRAASKIISVHRLARQLARGQNLSRPLRLSPNGFGPCPPFPGPHKPCYLGPTPPLTPPSPGDTCPRRASVGFYWWGVSLYLNSCIINELNGSGASLAMTFILGVISAVASKDPGVGVTTAGVIYAYLYWLTHADIHYCGGEGATFNKTWPYIPIPPWVSCTPGSTPTPPF